MQSRCSDLPALRHIGQQHVDDDVVVRLQKRLIDDDRKQLLQDIRYASAWIAAILRHVAKPEATPGARFFGTSDGFWVGLPILYVKV